MFNNVGKKIQTLISIIFGVEFLICCVCGIGIGAFIFNASNQENFFVALLVGLVVITIGTFFAWLSLLLIYAFGKIEECSEEQNRLLRELINLREKDAIEDGKTCSNCKQECRSDAEYCSRCGTKL